MRSREPWQHEWGTSSMSKDEDGACVVKPCKRGGCPWEMLSRKDSNRYRNGPNGKWMHAPKDCEGTKA